MSARAMLVALLLPAFCAGFAPPRPMCRPVALHRAARRAPRPVAMSAAAAPAGGGLATSAVGATMLAVSLAKYLPQIRRIVRSRSALGLAPTAYYGDSLVFAAKSMYHFRRGHPITAWGELLLIFAQARGSTREARSTGDEAEPPLPPVPSPSPRSPVPPAHRRTPRSAC